MRSRSLSALGHGSHDAPISLPLRWSHEGIDERRGGGCPDRQCARFFSVKNWPRLAAKTSLVVLATVFAAFLLHTQRRNAIRNDDLALARAASIFTSPRHHGHRVRAQAHRGFASSSPSAGMDALAATGFRDKSKAISEAPLPFTSVAVAGGELVQKSKPASLVIVVPFTSKDGEKVVDGLRKWSRPGDPCPAVRMLSLSSPGKRGSSAGTGSPVDVLFWFNRDLDEDVPSRDASAIKEAVLEALKPSSHCFGRVQFKSARLTDEEDAYPFGPSNQWYDLFLSPERPLAPYDYAFWSEHDVSPVQSGWVDALLREVTFPSVDFFVRGSLHRGRKLDDIVLYPDDASWVTHINGNALYKANDSVFTTMISQCREANRGSKSFMSSFDAAMWIRHVTSYASKWEMYQSYAHKFQYTDLIQNLNQDVPWPEGARDLVSRSPRTFLVHGSSTSAGEEHRTKAYDKGVAVDPAMLVPSPTASTATGEQPAAVLPYRPKVFPPGKVAVVIPLIDSQIEKLRVLFSLSSQSAFRACGPEKVERKKKELPVDLVFQISSSWLDESGAVGNEAYRSLSALLDEFPLFTSCFGEMHVRAAHLTPSQDVHTATVFTGPNLQFRRMMDDKWLRERYSHVLLLEPDATPIKHDWLQRLWLETRGGTEESFWIKGTAYRGFRGDWVRNRAPYNITRVSSMWAAMNGNGIYNLQDPEFYEFMDRVWEAHPDLPYDGAIHAYLFDVENFEHTKRALTKIRYSSYVQNHGATRFDVATLRRESPETYIVHSSCRDEFPNKKMYCFVCDWDTAWSEDCQVKLNSVDNLLGYDRYTTGPTYHGPEISNANEEEIRRENIAV